MSARGGSAFGGRKYLYLIFGIIILALGFYLGFLFFSPRQNESKINSLLIFNKLQSQGFLITQNYILEQRVTIDNTSGQIWRDFFWGQKIEASAVMKVNLGVDLQKLSQNDVKVSDQIEISLPSIETQSVEIVSDINLQNQQGIFKRILNNDNGYNLALNQLKEQAKTAASQPEIVQQAQASTQKEIERLVRLIADNKEIKVNFK
jgi:hypothetical protein